MWGGVGWGGGGHKLGAGFSQFGETKWKFSYFQLLTVCHCFCLCWGGGRGGGVATELFLP